MHTAIEAAAGAGGSSAAAATLPGLPASRQQCFCWPHVALFAIELVPVPNCSKHSGHLPSALTVRHRLLALDLQDNAGAWAVEGLRSARPLAQSAGYLLLMGCWAVTRTAPYVDILAVLGFGTLSPFRCHAADRACRRDGADCRNGLTPLVRCLRPGAAADVSVYSAAWLASVRVSFSRHPQRRSPVKKCISALRFRPPDNPGIGDAAAALFSRCLHWLLKGCGFWFSLAGPQSCTQGHGGQQHLRTGSTAGHSVVADAVVAALTGAAAAVQLLKVGPGGAAGTGRAFAPVLSEYGRALSLAAAGTGRGHR